MPVDLALGNLERTEVRSLRAMLELDQPCSRYQRCRYIPVFHLIPPGRLLGPGEGR